MIPAAKRNGLLGEIAAARYLREHGYTIVNANYRTRMGEVDLIARKGDILVFCEVKTRGEHTVCLPREAVDERKQRRITAAALEYVKQIRYTGPMRFDVAEVFVSPQGTMRVQLLENAFSGNDTGFFGL